MLCMNIGRCVVARRLDRYLAVAMVQVLRRKRSGSSNDRRDGCPEHLDEHAQVLSGS